MVRSPCEGVRIVGCMQFRSWVSRSRRRSLIGRAHCCNFSSARFVHAVAASHQRIAEKLRGDTFRDTRALPRWPATWCRLRLCAHQVAGMRECGKLSGRQKLDSWVAHVFHPQCNAAAMSVEPHTWPLHRSAHHHPQCQPRAQKYPKGACELFVHQELRHWPKI